MEVWGSHGGGKRCQKETEQQRDTIDSGNGNRALHPGQARGTPRNSEMNRTEHLSVRCSQSKEVTWTTSPLQPTSKTPRRNGAGDGIFPGQSTTA